MVKAAFGKDILAVGKVDILLAMIFLRESVFKKVSLPRRGKNAQRNWREPSNRIQALIIERAKGMIHSPFLCGFGFGLIPTPNQVFALVPQMAIGA